MTGKKEERDKTQDILAAVFITIVFIAVISGIFIKLANITYEIEKTAEETKQLKETSQNVKDNAEEEKDNNSKEPVKKEPKQIKIEPEVTEEYVPIKFLWTGDNEGYWIKTEKDDKEWYSIEEGIYPCFVHTPQITQMTFRINGENADYEVITGWEGNFYIWLPKLENEEYESGLFASKEKGTLLLYDNGWENSFNQTYSGKNKIDLLPKIAEEKLLNAYKIYTDNMQNQNIQDEEIDEEENGNQETAENKPENQE